jgi:arsenate reductase-like glutaredoxin family protein
LREQGLEVDEINYARQPLDEATLLTIVEAAGGVARVLNARQEVARARGWTVEQPPSAAEFAAAAAAEPNLLRRPILILGDQVLVGYDRKTEGDWARLGKRQP